MVIKCQKITDIFLEYNVTHGKYLEESVAKTLLFFWLVLFAYE